MDIPQLFPQRPNKIKLCSQSYYYSLTLSPHFVCVLHQVGEYCGPRPASEVVSSLCPPLEEPNKASFPLAPEAWVVSETCQAIFTFSQMYLINGHIGLDPNLLLLQGKGECGEHDRGLIPPLFLSSIFQCFHFIERTGLLLWRGNGGAFFLNPLGSD